MMQLESVMVPLDRSKKNPTRQQSDHEIHVDDLVKFHRAITRISSVVTFYLFVVPGDVVEKGKLQPDRRYYAHTR